MTLFKTSLLALATTAALLGAPAWAAERKVHIKVAEMTCPSCAFTVSRSMRWVPGVEILDFTGADAEGVGIFTVQYDDAEASAEDIIAAVAENGYPAELVEDGS